MYIINFLLIFNFRSSYPVFSKGVLFLKTISDWEYPLLMGPAFEVTLAIVFIAEVPVAVVEEDFIFGEELK